MIPCVRRSRRGAGFSTVELLALMAVVGLTLGAASIYLKPAAAPVATGAVLLENYLRLVRARAAATTSAYRVTPDGESRVSGEYAGACDAASWTADPDLVLDLPEDSRLATTGWLVCFSPRGVSAANVVIGIEGGTRQEQVEVTLGGAVRIVP